MDMAKKKMNMHQTLKVNIFGKITVKGIEVPVINIIDGHLVINSEYCDLRTIRERYNSETKELVPSAVDSILCSESVLTMHYGKHNVEQAVSIADSTPMSCTLSERNTLLDFITVDCSEGDDSDPETMRIKELLCFDGLYLPLSKLLIADYVPHDEAEIVEVAGVEHIRYRAAMQSASENRQCKLTMTTYNWEEFARKISGDARYLYEPTQTAQKAISRQGLGKTNGNIVEAFNFTYA